jgi:hypothetical protein
MRSPSSHSDAKLCVGGMSVRIALSSGPELEPCDFVSDTTKLLIVIFVVVLCFGVCDKVFKVEVLETLEVSSWVAETFETTELMVPKSIFSVNSSRIGSCLV